MIWSSSSTFVQLVVGIAFNPSGDEGTRMSGTTYLTKSLVAGGPIRRQAECLFTQTRGDINEESDADPGRGHARRLRGRIRRAGGLCGHKNTECLRGEKSRM